MFAKEYVICDIDGTLADIDHRRPLVEGKKKDFKTFLSPEQVQSDGVHYDVEFIALALAFQQYKIVLVSGRPENLREVTEDWLGSATILPYAHLFMRADGDFRSDAIVKREIYETKLIPLNIVPDNTLCVLDDRQRVVDMWRELGFRCLQVAPGDF